MDDLTQLIRRLVAETVATHWDEIHPHLLPLVQSAAQSGVTEYQLRELVVATVRAEIAEFLRTEITTIYAPLITEIARRKAYQKLRQQAAAVGVSLPEEPPDTGVAA